MTHTCHAIGCDLAVAPKFLMCGRHWRMVPAYIQKLVWKHYRRGQEIDKRPSANYLEAMKAAINAVYRQEVEVEGQRDMFRP